VKYDKKLGFWKTKLPLVGMKSALVAIFLIANAFFVQPAMAQQITMASTTSTEQSGLFGHLLPEFKKATGIEIKVVALGTGQALDCT
jgi:tungstate transport system substrate-binding protein